MKLGLGALLQVRGWVKGGEQRFRRYGGRDVEWMAQKREGQRKVKQVDDKGGGQDSCMEMMKN